MIVMKIKIKDLEIGDVISFDTYRPTKIPRIGLITGLTWTDKIPIILFRRDNVIYADEVASIRKIGRI